MDKQTYCFSHLNVNPDQHQDETVPWWLALVIAVPLAVITIGLIKIAHVYYDKKQLKENTPRRSGSKYGIL